MSSMLLQQVQMQQQQLDLGVLEGLEVPHGGRSSEASSESCFV
jgi:hypothetical protein